MDGLIKNIEELPENLQDAIRRGIRTQIIGEADFYKEERETELLAYLDAEIKQADNSMLKMQQESTKVGAELFGISKTYVWNKEKKKALINYKNDYMSQLQAKASNCGQLQTNGSKRGKGRPSKSFYDYLLGDEETKKATLSKMHTLIDGKYGKDVVLVLRAAMEKGLISKPTHTPVKKEFGDIGSYQNYDTYMNRYIFTDEELKGMMGNF